MKCEPGCGAAGGIRDCGRGRLGGRSAASRAVALPFSSAGKATEGGPGPRDPSHPSLRQITDGALGLQQSLCAGPEGLREEGLGGKDSGKNLCIWSSGSLLSLGLWMILGRDKG